ncbi:hypothetical protein RUND412_009353 [Rhizina undulata]
MAPSCILLSTGNIMTAGAQVIRKPSLEKSNTELINSLHENFRAAKAAVVSVNGEEHVEIDVNGRPLEEWTKTGDDGVMWVPAPAEDDNEEEGLSEDRDQYDITVKLFHLPHLQPSSRPVHTRTAISHVLRTLAVPSIDLLILSFPTISFDADDISPPSADLPDLLPTYSVLEELHGNGTIKDLGVSEFSSERLDGFLQQVSVKPKVNQINVRDCCVVPKPLILFAKEKGVELLTHNDEGDILPQKTVEELLKEFAVLGESASKVLPVWVVKYTAVVRSRGVVENKGYIAMVEVS